MVTCGQQWHLKEKLEVFGTPTASCNVAIETFSHIKWCESYAELRIAKDLEDDKNLVSYVFEVMKRRASKKDVVPLLSGPNGL